MRDFPNILSLFHNDLYKFKNTGARMLDYIYYMTLKLQSSRFCSITLRNSHIYATLLRLAIPNVYTRGVQKIRGQMLPFPQFLT